MDIEEDVQLYAYVIKKPEGVFRDPAAVERLRRHLLQYHGATPKQLAQAVTETEKSTQREAQGR